MNLSNIQREPEKILVSGAAAAAESDNAENHGHSIRRA